MSEVIRIRDFDPCQQAVEAGTRSTVAAILAHVQDLADQALASDTPAPTSSKYVRQVIAARAARRKFFDGDLFADPAWDILLELYALQCEQRRTSVSKLCIAAAVPATTALRWIDKLHKDGLIERVADPLDARRVWVSLSEATFVAMKAYLSELGHSRLPL